MSIQDQIILCFIRSETEVSSNADKTDIEESWRFCDASDPPEMLEEMGLGVGQDVVVSSEGDGIRVEPSEPRPSKDAVEFMARFTKKYDEAMRNLARR